MNEIADSSNGVHPLTTGLPLFSYSWCNIFQMYLLTSKDISDPGVTRVPTPAGSDKRCLAHKAVMPPRSQQ